MQLYKLRSFITVADTQHLTRAADKLHTSQPTVSAHIKALETQLGLQLFQRTAKGMLLTPEGQALLPYAKKIIEQNQLSLQQAQQLQKKPIYTCHIGLASDTPLPHSEAFIRQLHIDYPQLHLHVIQKLSGELVELVQQQKLDCAFVLGEGFPTEVSYHTLQKVQLGVAVPQQLIDKVTGKTWTELSALPWILTPEKCGHSRAIGDFFTRHAMQQISHRVSADNSHAIKALLLAGMGLALIPYEKLDFYLMKDKISLWQGDAIHTQVYFIYSQQALIFIKKLTELAKNLWKNKA